MSGFLGTRPLLFACAQKPSKIPPLLPGVHVSACAQACVPRRAQAGRGSQGAGDGWLGPIFLPGALGCGSSGEGPRDTSPPPLRAPPLPFAFPAPPVPRRPAPPRANPLPPVTPMLTEALSGRRAAGWWLLPLRLQCALWLGAAGGRWRCWGRRRL